MRVLYAVHQVPRLHFGSRQKTLDESKKGLCIASLGSPHFSASSSSILKFCKLYRHFIKDFSRIAVPLTDLTKKDIVFQWSPDCNQALKFLKNTFIKAPVLEQFDTDHKTVLACDTSR